MAKLDYTVSLHNNNSRSGGKVKIGDGLKAARGDALMRGRGPNEPDETSLGYMLRLAAPMIVMNVSLTVMQFVDRYMVSRLGTAPFAAVLPAALVGFVPLSLAIGVSASINTFVSQSMGRGRPDECSAYCWQGLYMGAVYFGVVLLLLWPFAPQVFRVMGHPPDVIKLEVTYLRIVLFAQFGMVLVFCINNFFMGIHRPVIIMWAAIVGQVVNVAANYVLIFGKLGFPAMGIAGAAWGTFIGIMVGMVIRGGAFLSTSVDRDFKSRSSLAINYTKMAQILRVGLPAGISSVIMISLWPVCLFWLVGLFGKEPLAASSAVFSSIHMSFMPVVGIAAALTAAVGKSIGEGQANLASRQTQVCLRVSALYMGLAGAAFFIFREQIMNFWSDEPGVINAGTKILICAAIFQIFDAAAIIYGGALRGAGDTMWLVYVQAVCSGVIMVGGGVLLVLTLPQLGPVGPWIACAAYVIAVSLANHWRFRSGRWRQIDIFKRGPVAMPVEVEAIVD